MIIPILYCSLHLLTTIYISKWIISLLLIPITLVWYIALTWYYSSFWAFRRVEIQAAIKCLINILNLKLRKVWLIYLLIQISSSLVILLTFLRRNISRYSTTVCVIILLIWIILILCRRLRYAIIATELIFQWNLGTLYVLVWHICCTILFNVVNEKLIVLYLFHVKSLSFRMIAIVM